MKNNKIVATVLSVFLTVISSATALEVDEIELKSTGSTGIEFTNYTGPHSVIETADAITEIGRGLGRQVAKNVNVSSSFGLNGKYAVIHAVDTKTNEKLDADIIIINKDATVDHIRNLRRIIAGYLTTAYGYSNADATTIATFATVYNAVYRGKLDTLKSKYKDVVIKNLTAEKCGLSTVWSDWPGKTQIVIPLNDLKGGLSTVDTSIISDKNVVDNMREQDDKGIDERKNMVDIKEREADDAYQKALDAQDKADEQNKKLDQKAQDAAKAQADADKAKQQADKAKAEADKAKQQAEKAKQDAANNPNDVAKQQDAAKAQAEAEKAKQDAAKAQAEAEKAKQQAEAEKAKAEEQKKLTDKANEEAKKQQDFADKKQEEAQNERYEIAKDQQRLLQDALATPDSSGAVIGLKVVNKAADLSQLVKVNAETGAVIKVSPVGLIHRRTVLPVINPIIEGNTASPASTANVVQTEASVKDTYYMAVCGDSSSATKLCLLDSNYMEIQKESVEFVAPDSVLVTDGTYYYCVIQDESNWVVGKYDKSLNLELKSPVSVESNTPITLTTRGVIVTDSNGVVVLLNSKDLSKK